MLASKLYSPTLREIPADAEIASHQYMLKAGMLRKNGSGLYSFLPLGRRVTLKVEQIVREEMDATGAQEIMMPIMQPAEIWHESGRWSAYGPEMFKLQDRHDNGYCLGPTHEELITTLLRNELRSYKQMPLILWQMQNKYRDEIRPRFGLMRSREFVMKDAYSFDVDEEGLHKTYQIMYDAYDRVFTRCGLNFKPVEADSGQIGGSHTHEFMALAAAGEAEVVSCSKCQYAADIEKAVPNTLDMAAEDAADVELIETPDCSTIEDLANFLQIPVEKTIKAVAFDVDGKTVLCMVRGDHEVNDVAVQNLVGGNTIEPATDEELKDHGLQPGYMSPMGADTPDNESFYVIVDPTAMNVPNGVTGANKHGYHYKNVNPKRDFQNVTVATIRLMTKDDVCPHCGAPIDIVRGIEVGQVFELGTKYSEALNATFLDQNGKAKPYVMGCYGIGVTRTIAAAIEQFHDDKGIMWPVAIAPYEVVVVPVSSKDEEQMKIAEGLYTQLKGMGVDVLFDDRNERAGVKFNDADLIGYPVRITVGKKSAADQTVEIKVRRTGHEEVAAIADSAARVQAILNELRANNM
ncbi:proline--tRNA ligase [Megasphaera stantonii]|uniref:proline--tRNA ligase n=1 Tax=Megasphaera stantonii TaxID=2144175 RepID=UPI0019599649|nr:proline--tRNA ligase [Megasphaera stantonii]MBM6731759.1 proline--tRNA ligase [Megasphaera stantonii]